MVLFWLKVRNNYFIRLCLFPFIKLQRWLEFNIYRRSESYQYIKSMHNKFNGQRCFIVGNGPSLTKEDLDLLAEEKSFGFNNIFHIYDYTKWRPTFYMIIDKNIIGTLNKINPEEIKKSEVFVNNHRIVKKLKNSINIHQIILRGKYFLKKEKMVMNTVSQDVSEKFSITHTVAISAIEFAFYLGFKEIYLLGMDFDFAITIDMDGKKNINKNTVPHFKEMKDKKLYPAYREAMEKCFETCRQYADEHGIQIMNVTRGGKLEVFKREKLENILEINSEKRKYED